MNNSVAWRVDQAVSGAPSCQVGGSSGNTDKDSFLLNFSFDLTDAGAGGSQNTQPSVVCNFIVFANV